ncbi:replication-associated recombination protein RarA [Bradyrhizobium japonicum]
MNQALALKPIRTLSNLLRSFEEPHRHPLDCTPWVAQSALQKAIRRGRTQIALAAAATLLQQAPERLWRRLACIAFEDVGIGNLELVTLVTAAMAGRKARASLGGEWKVASLLITMMAEATKCRAADDLLLVAENHLSFQAERLQLSELIQVLGATGDKPRRTCGIALSF